MSVDDKKAFVKLFRRKQYKKKKRRDFFPNLRGTNTLKKADTTPIVKTEITEVVEDWHQIQTNVFTS